MTDNLDDLVSSSIFTLRMASHPIRRTMTEDEALAGTERTDLVEYLRWAYRDTAFSVAVAHAAPTLWDTAVCVINGTTTPKLSKLRRAAVATAKFLNRMTTRPTPFGLFAGVAPGHFSDSPTPPRTTPSTGKRVAHADFRWLMPLVRELEQDPDLLAETNAYRSPYLRTKGDHVVLYRGSTSGAEQSRLAIRRNPALTFILEECGTAGVSVQTLCTKGARQLNVDAGALLRLVQKLVGLDMLYTDLRPTLTGDDPLEEEVGRLERVGKQPTALKTALNAIRTLSSTGTDPLSPETLTRTYEALGAIGKSTDRVHFTLRTGMHVQMPETVKQDATSAMRLMQILSPRRLGMRGLRKYHLEFLERYGIDRVVPITTLVDPDRGLGVPRGYSWPKQDLGPNSDFDDETNERREGRLARLYAETLRQDLREVVLGEDDLAELSYSDFDPNDCQLGAELYFSISSPTWEAVQAGHYRLVLGPNPGSHFAQSTAGRFLGVLPELANDTAFQPLDNDEEYSAVLSYFTRSSAATNLVNVPPFNEPIIDGGVPREPTRTYVPLSRIGVKATMRGLFPVDLSDGRAIRIRTHSTVYPPAQATNEVRLLSDMMLEFQRLWEPWSWGKLEFAPYTPRVRSGRIVLAPATWNLNELRQRGISTAANPTDIFDEWKSRWDVPQYVLAVSRDMRLVLDTSNAGHVELLRQELRKDKDLVFQELPAGAKTPHEAWGWLSEGEKAYASELVVSFARQDTKFAPERFNVKAAPSPYDPPRYLPGSPWQSYRLYLPSDEMGPLLRGTLGSILTTVAEKDPDSAPFFVRYADEQGPHLRVRLAIRDPSNTSFTDTLQHLCGTGQIRTYVHDEYVPEAERYGGPEHLSVMHRVFSEDSLAVLRALHLPVNDAYSNLEEFVLVSWAEMLVAFGAGHLPNTVATPDMAKPDPIHMGRLWTETIGLEPSRDRAYSGDRERWTRCVQARFSTHRDSAEWKTIGLGRNALFGSGRLHRINLQNKEEFASAERVIGSYMHMTFNRAFGPDPDREQFLLGILRSVFTRLDNEQSARRRDDTPR
ncbi:lantibiotic dehydratase [Brevibacterium luteolum]|uniref:lantibiotic dehydratase n=1 Tax=Brevibacterium luteolum TaxID=199591 RepID=UPI00223AD6C4|nr:lantibiotic dehydratase [Brevibacterium luteolum]MCT1830677.1 lantibiotic dehydratase [Brevibacterium luteolum]